MPTAPQNQFRPRRSTAAATGAQPAPLCYFCVGNVHNIDGKDIQTLQRFVSSHGKIMPRRRSGVCAFHQRKLARAIKRARSLSMMPFAV